MALGGEGRVDLGAWFFVSLPFDASDEIEAVAGPGRSDRGFGSVRVEVTIGDSTWRTSVFPSTEQKTYVLPVKKAVRVAEGLEEGSTATVRLSSFDFRLNGYLQAVPVLRRTSPDQPGWTRRRAGKGWVFLDENGDRLTGEDAERCRALVIPRPGPRSGSAPTRVATSRRSAPTRRGGGSTSTTRRGSRSGQP